MRRVFTPDERERITRARRPDALLWSLWAAKETAYKIVSKITPGVSSVPGIYEVTYDGEAEETISGAVNTPCGKVIIQSFVNHDYIHCIGIGESGKGIRDVIWGVDEITGGEKTAANYESLCVRETAGKRLAAYLGGEPGEIDILRPERSSGLGPPLVFFRGIRAGLDISLSHDGRFAAYAFIRTDLT
jgi:hypothetical protein